MGEISEALEIPNKPKGGCMFLDVSDKIPSRTGEKTPKEDSGYSAGNAEKKTAEKTILPAY